MTEEFLHPDAWTSGAYRSFTRAAQVATHRGSREIAPRDLLWALIVDEGRAGLQLTEVGITLGSLAELDSKLSETALEDVGAVEPLAGWGADAMSVAKEARHVAFQTGDLDQAGTNHLLEALARMESEVAAIIRKISLHATATASPVEPLMEDPVAQLAFCELDLSLRERSAPSFSQLYRIVDAASNRVREGFRVIEDFTRFGLNDEFLTQQLKTLRHEFSGVMRTYPASDLLSSRDTLGDVGTEIGTREEYHRTDLTDVVTAACKRCQEGLRTLEECGKIVSGDISPRLERLRYQMYTLERAILQTQHSRDRLGSQQLYVLLTEAQCPCGVGRVLRESLDAGVRMFQVREKSTGDRALVDHCRRLRRWTREAGALLIVNDRPDIAVLVDADGVHVGQEELRVSDARRIVGPDRIVGVSTHSIEQARQAVLDGADYLGVGPTFPSGTKSFLSFPGLDLLRQVSAEITLPWFAIGGIDEGNLMSAVAAGATRVAVSGAVCRSPQPKDAARLLLAELAGAWNGPPGDEPGR